MRNNFWPPFFLNSFVGCSAITTVDATRNRNNVNIVEVSNSSTLQVTSGVFGSISNGGIARVGNCATSFKGVSRSNRSVSRTITLIFGTPRDCANRSIIRLSYRNKLCVAGEILHTILGTNTIPTRTKRFAGQTFLGNGVSLARTRTMVSVVDTGDENTTESTLYMGRNTLHGGVSNMGGSLLSVTTRLST